MQPDAVFIFCLPVDGSHRAELNETIPGVYKDTHSQKKLQQQPLGLNQ